ncbi:MAG TPA: ABC transporter permease [Actinomycetota bacterium]|nr:ABC transporter permease [Actinomycetota bacterium]
MKDTLDSRTLKVLIGIGAGALVLLISRVVLGEPTGLLVRSLFPACSAGLTAVGLVLIYRSIRVINFAQMALAVVGMQMFYELYTRRILPYEIALPIGIIAGVLVATVIGIMSATLFFRHPRLAMTVVTILFTGLIGYISGQITQAFTPDGEQLTIHTVPLDQTFANTKVFEIDALPFRVAHLYSTALLAILLIGLVVFFRRTRIGMAIRASAENADRASLLGINVKSLQVGVWALSGLIACVGAIAAMPIDQYQPTAAVDQTALLLPLVAAVVARMQNMGLAFATGVGMVVLRSAIVFKTNDPTFVEIGLFLLLMGLLLIQRNKLQGRIDNSTSWKAVKEPRPTPREMLALPVIRRTRRIIFLVLIAAALGFPWIVGLQTLNIVTFAWLMAMIGSSLVILTGWTGQISLGQFAIVAVGAFVAGNLTSRIGIPFWFAAPLAGMAGAAVSLLLGIPALRIRGLFLAVATFGFAIALPRVLFEESLLGKYVPLDVHRPKLFFINFENDKWMYYLAIVFFALTALGLNALRKSRGGRVLIGLRDNEQGIQSFGIDVVRTRLIAFGIAGFIAAFAGAIMVHAELGMDRGTYAAPVSIQLFILVVIGGVSTVMGAALGAFFFVVMSSLFPSFALLISGVLGLIVMMAIPGGFTQIVFGIRDAVLRVIAMRRHIVVPSLFADYSPEAWEKRLAPLSPASQSNGLAALPAEQRYALPSKVFEGAKA